MQNLLQFTALHLNICTWKQMIKNPSFRLVNIVLVLFFFFSRSSQIISKISWCENSKSLSINNSLYIYIYIFFFFFFFFFCGRYLNASLFNSAFRILMSDFRLSVLINFDCFWNSKQRPSRLFVSARRFIRVLCSNNLLIKFLLQVGMHNVKLMQTYHRPKCLLFSIN